MKIRPYEEKDNESVRFVCLNSEGPSKSSKSTQHFVLTTYCDYYLEKEPHNCFVAEDECGNIAGYIICSENYDRFREIFLREYLPRIPKYNLFRRISATLSTELHAVYKNEYPAHLHIDVLPEYQRMGIGHKLTDALSAHLKQKNIKGVMLTVNASNKKGVGFYKKYGFTFLEERKGSAAYGLKLN